MYMKNFLLVIFFGLINSLNIKMCINNNNNNYNLPIKKLENGDNNHLILLNNVITSQWCKNWINDIVTNVDTEEYPQFMVSDIMSMRMYCELNNESNYFYIGYTPSSINTRNGPIYIGAFRLIPEKRIFSIDQLIQNPNNDFNKPNILDFKKDLDSLAISTDCKMDIINLKNYSQNRYWLDFNLF